MNEEKNYIYKYEIESNKELENYIKTNMEQIRRMWKTGLWSYFSSEDGNILTLYKRLLSETGYKIYSKQKIVIINEKKEKKTIYYIEKK